MKRRITYLFCLFFIMAFTGYAAEIKVLDAVSGIKDGEVVIAFIFDKPVDPKFIYDDFISIATGGNYYYKKGVIDPDKRVIYYTGFPSDKKFKVSVWQGFQGANGTVLEEDFSKQLTTPALKADAWFSESGIESVRPEDRKLEINISNLRGITVNYYAIPFSASRPFAANLPEALNMLTVSDMVVSKSYKINFQDKRGKVLIEPPEELFNVKGLYFAAVADADGLNTSFTAFLVNDLNIHARYYPLAKKNNLAVWLRSGGEPLPEAAVRVFGKADENSSAVTDAFGKAVFTVSGGIDNIGYITAQKGTLSAALFGTERFNLSGYDTAGDVYSDLSIFIYGSKDIYLKNETVRYYIVARGENGKALEADKADFILTAPDGGTINSSSKLNSGYAEFSSKLENSMPAGEWKLTVKIGEGAAERVFTVENPHKARLALLNEAKTLLTDNISALNPAVSGESGGSAATGILKGNYRLKTVSHIKGYEDFSFGGETAAETFSFTPRNLNDGKAVLALNALPADEQFSPVAVEYDLRLFERDAETARLVKKAVFLPAGEAAGIRYIPGTGESVFQIISLDASGAPKKTSFSCLLLKEEDGIDWSESEGWKPESSATVYPLAEQNFETGETLKEIKFRTPPGRYRIELKNAASAYARTFSFEAGSADALSASGEIRILLDKEAYLPGETLTAAISSPFDGSGQLLVEDSEGVLRSQAFTVTNGKGDVAFPINNRWKRQDIYITAFMYANKNAEKSKNAGDMVFGITHIPIDRNGIRLEIQHPDVILSGKDIEVVVRASENFEGASVTLALVEDNLTDASVSNLDPEGFFSRRLAYMPVILDNSATGIKKTENTGIVENTGRFAHPSAAVVFANPVSFDKNGEARFKMRIPDNNGNLRLLAMAFGQEAFGSESSSLK